MAIKLTTQNNSANSFNLKIKKAAAKKEESKTDNSKKDNSSETPIPGGVNN